MDRFGHFFENPRLVCEKEKKILQISYWLKDKSKKKLFVFLREDE